MKLKTLKEFAQLECHNQLDADCCEVPSLNEAKLSLEAIKWAKVANNILDKVRNAIR